MVYYQLFVDSCVYEEWTDWGTCSETCGGGQQNRTRIKTKGGDDCTEILESQACNTDDCNTDPCVYEEWTDWGTCSETCGGGQQNRTRTKTSGGDDCTELEESQACNTEDCKRRKRSNEAFKGNKNNLSLNTW